MTLTIMSTRSGKEREYQDDEARKAEREAQKAERGGNEMKTSSLAAEGEVTMRGFRGQLYHSDGTFLRQVTYMLFGEEGRYGPAEPSDDMHSLQLELESGERVTIIGLGRREHDGEQTTHFRVQGKQR